MSQEDRDDVPVILNQRNRSSTYERFEANIKRIWKYLRERVFTFRKILTFFVATALLFSVVATKLTIVATGQQFNVSCTEASCILEEENETPYLMIVIMMITPQLISFIMAIANSAFTNEPWPSIAAGLLVSSGL